MIRSHPLDYFKTECTLPNTKRFFIELAKKLLFIKTPTLPFGDQKWTGSEWAGHAIENTKFNIERCNYSMILAHPACMEVLDGMETYRLLLNQLQKLNVQIDFLKI